MGAFDKFYSGDMAPPTRVGGKLVPTSADTDWNDFYGSVGITGTEPAGSGLTTRSVQTVAIDPFTGEPIKPSGSPSPAVLAALNAQMKGRGQPPALGTASAEAAADRLAGQDAGLPLNPTGQYHPANPLVLSALQAQQGAQQGRNPIKPSWANPPGFGPRFPVQATPEIRQAYADLVAGKPGAMKTYAGLLAAAGPNVGGGQRQLVPTGTFRSSNSGQQVTVGATHVGTDGYTYQAMPDGTFKNLGYSADEQAKRAAAGKAIGDANRASPSPTHDVAGNNNAFMPASVQNSVRWQTGY